MRAKNFFEVTEIMLKYPTFGGGFFGWKNSSGHKRRILVDKIGEFSWTLFTNSRGHFCPLEFLFWGDFSWTLFWWILVDIFGEFFNSNDMSHTITNLTHRGLKLDGAIGQGEICNSLKSEHFWKSFLSHIGKNKIKI